MPGAKPQSPPLTLILSSDRLLLITWRVFLLLCAIAVGMSIGQLLQSLSHIGWLAYLAGLISTVLTATLLLRQPAPPGFEQQVQLQLTQERFILQLPDQEPLRGEWQLHWHLPGLTGLKLQSETQSRVIWLTPRRTGPQGWHAFMQLLTLSGRATPV